MVASAAGYGYLIRSLLRSERWPRPFEWPSSFRCIERFLRFAGPVLMAVVLCLDLIKSTIQ